MVLSMFPRFKARGTEVAGEANWPIIKHVTQTSVGFGVGLLALFSLEGSEIAHNFCEFLRAIFCPFFFAFLKSFEENGAQASLTLASPPLFFGERANLTPGRKSNTYS